jgi:NADH dehydrogenase
MSLPKVVIVGAGFGGLACARALARKPVEVLLLDRHNYHLFTPLLYQVASSLLNPSEIAYPIRAVFRKARNVRVRVAEVVGADLDAHWVAVTDGEGGAMQRLAFDYLVLALGSNSNFFGNAAIANASHGLKDLPEALELRNHVLRCFEAAAREADEDARRPWLTFAIVGGGPTGVEYAGALVELIRLVLVKDYPELNLHKVHIVLLEGREQILPAFPKALGDDAELRLRQRGIDVRLNTRVESIGGDVITLSGGQKLRSRTLVWAAGVKPNELVAHLRLPMTRTGRVEVDPQLHVAGYERVFAIGDIAAVQYRGGEMAQLSPPAMQEGRCAARNILHAVRGEPLEAFRYFDKGTMATIGRNDAVAILGPLKLKGLIGWLTWLFVHLMYIVGFRNRIVVLVEWAWDYFRYDRPIRLIERAKEHTAESSRPSAFSDVRTG